MSLVEPLIFLSSTDQESRLLLTIIKKTPQFSFKFSDHRKYFYILKVSIKLELPSEFYLHAIRVSNRNSVARNCSRIACNCAELRGIMRNYAQFLGIYRARNCAQVKSTCVGNPTWQLRAL